MLFGLPAECRREERVGVEMGAELLDEARGEWRTAEVVDLSWHRMRVCGDRLALKCGGYVDLVITQGADWDRRWARVAWVADLGGHALEAGLEFL